MVVVIVAAAEVLFLFIQYLAVGRGMRAPFLLSANGRSAEEDEQVKQTYVFRR
jgi:hypothetical protein